MGGQQLRLHGGNYLTGCISLKIHGSSFVQHLVISWQEALLLCVWKPSSSREHCNSLQKSYLCLPGYYVGLEGDIVLLV